MPRIGLRGKSLLALLLACLLALVPALFVGWAALDNIRSHLGRAYARDVALLERQRILSPILRELALSRRLANSEITHAWLQDETNTVKRDMFFREAEGYRHDFRDHSYFVIDHTSLHYYFNDDHGALSPQPRYTLKASDPNDAWYFATMRNTADYNVNVDYDDKLNTTKVWFNIVVHDGATPLGLAGTGLDLTTFLHDFVSSAESGVTPMLITRDGAIQAHPNPKLIALNTVGKHASNAHSVFSLLPRPAEQATLRAAIEQAQAHPDDVTVCEALVDGKSQLLAVAYLPELNWFTVTAFDVSATHIIDPSWAKRGPVFLITVLAILLAGFGLSIERLLLRPLLRLRQSAQAVAEGRYDIALPPASHDEIGELTQAFDVMAQKVLAHTEQLEQRVSERTHELEEANRRMAAAHKQIDDSIDYASIIQRAILPDRQLLHSLGAHHFVVWRPRDVVGGDFYVFRADGPRSLLGVVDCAGHGVPGALMTMLARSAIDHAINEVGTADPAAILTRTEQTIRNMLADTTLPRTVATNMDAGLVYIDREAGHVIFAGAHLSLYYSDGENVFEVKGARRAMVDKRPGEFHNRELLLSRDVTFYLTTDGFLDQAGGEHGYGFGNTRFADLLKENARLPLAEQADAFLAALTAYQGTLPQRDDITVLSFRFE